MTDIRISKNILDGADYLKKGKVIIAPTDTLYGVLSDALNKEAVEKVYRLKGRTPTKPVIILIPSIDFLEFFCVKPSEKEKKLLLHKGITVVIEIPEECKDKFFYLHRGKGSLGFRIPNKKDLIDLMKIIGRPLIAPSANPEGEKPAEDINQAISYFGISIDLYIDGGKLKRKFPSTVVKIENGIYMIREGNVKREDIEKILKG